MWIEKIEQEKNNKKIIKYKYFERYKNPYTEKWKRVSVTLTSKSNQAKKQATQLLQDEIDIRLKNAKFAKNSNYTLEELINDWWNLHKKTIRNSSIKAYQKVINYTLENIETDVLIRNCDTSFFQDFISELPHSFEYNKKFKSVLNMAFEYAVDLEYTKNNPIARVKVPRPALNSENFENIQEKYLEEEEVTKLLEVYYSSFQSIHMGRLAEFMYLTGLRAGEAISITKADVDIQHRLLKINGTLDYSNGYKNAKKEPPKTLSSFREIGLSKRAVEILEELLLENELKHPDTAYLFVGKTGNPIQINSFNASLKLANEKLGKNKIQKSISSHIFRHSHISLLSELGVEPKAIMERVGHSDIETTMKIYTHVTKKSKENILDKLDNR